MARRAVVARTSPDFERETRPLSGVELLFAVADFDEFLTFIASGGRHHDWCERFGVSLLSLKHWIQKQPGGHKIGPMRYVEAMQASALAFDEQAEFELLQARFYPNVSANLELARHYRWRAGVRNAAFNDKSRALQGTPTNPLGDDPTTDGSPEDAAAVAGLAGQVSEEQTLTAALEVLRSQGYEIDINTQPEEKE